MAYKHVVRMGDGRLVESGLFEPADEARVKEATEIAKKLHSAHDFLEYEGRRRWEMVRNGAITGTALFLVASGGIPAFFGMPSNHFLWFGAAPEYQAVVSRYPQLFGVLGMEVAAFWALERYSSSKKRKYQSARLVEMWNRRQFTNDELVHVFTVQNKLDPSYRQDDLYYYPDEVPSSVRKFFYKADPKTKQKDKVLKSWDRARVEGKFYLTIGEVYERDGRFNATPKVLRIPDEGLWTGIAVFGPTGSGKSQSVLLPMLDQFVRYYSWVDSERDLWMVEVPARLRQMEQELEALEGAPEHKAKAEKYARLKAGYEERVALGKKGEEWAVGFEKMGITCIEPKNEMWRDLYKLLVAIGREKDYLELGTIRDRYERFLEWSTKLTRSAQTMWASLPDSYTRSTCNNYLVQLAEDNGIKPNGEEKTPLPERVYGTAWLRKITDVVTLRGKAGGELRADAGDESAYTVALDGMASTLVTPFCFRMGGNPGVKTSLVGPFGLGTENEPWTARVWAKVGGAPNAQKAYTDVFDCAVRVFGLMGHCFQFRGDGETIEGVFRSVDWRGKLAQDWLQSKPVADRAGEQDGEGGVDGSGVGSQRWHLNQARQEEPRDVENVGQFHNQFQEGLLADVSLLGPSPAPNAVLIPEIKGAGEPKGEKDAPQPDHDQVRQVLNLIPAERVELCNNVRKPVRFSAPISKIPGEKRADFRVRYRLWWARRREIMFRFVEGALVALDDADPKEFNRVIGRIGLATSGAIHDQSPVWRDGRVSNAGLAGVNLDLRRRNGADLADQAFELFCRKAGLGFVRGVLHHFLHHPLTVDLAVRELEEAGWVYEGDLRREQQRMLRSMSKVVVQETGRGPEQMEAFPYDHLIYGRLTPSEALRREVGKLAKVVMGEGGWPKDAPGYLVLQRGLERHREAVLLGAVCRLARREYLGEALASSRLVLLKRVQIWVDSALPAEMKDRWCAHDHVDPGLGQEVVDALLGEARRAQSLYEFDPRVPDAESVSEDIEDLENLIDCSPVGIALGPWDALWSEAMGERLWDDLRGVFRKTLTNASNLMAASDRARLAKVGLEPYLRPRIDAPPRSRREQVLHESLNYLTRIEEYLRAVSPYYKTNTPFAFGYADAGGIGNCCGSNKFNPMHLPDATPNQVASGLMGVLNRNAGDGDTSFWADAGIMASEHMVALLRSAFGYVSVTNLAQVLASDGFIDMAIARAAKRIQRLQEAQGGEGVDPAASLLKSQWLRYQGRRDTEAERRLSVLPAECQRVFPRAPSAKELEEVRRNFEAGSVFINDQWRSPTGMFADKEIRGTVMLNLMNQLTPLTKDIGAYSFSPEDGDEISFPTAWEIRSEGNVMATRFNLTSDPKLGGLVISMFITGYQQMVLSAKEMETQAKETYDYIARNLSGFRDELAALRRERRDIQGKLGKRRAERETVFRFLSARAQEGQSLSPMPDAQEFGKLMARELLALEAEGKLGGEITPEVISGLDLQGAGPGPESRVSRVRDSRVRRDPAWVAEVQAVVLDALGALLPKRMEKEIEIGDRLKRVEKRIWYLRQAILNALSTKEDFPNFSRICAHVIDEYQMFKNLSKKGTLGDEIFLSASRAGKSINVYCTQTPSSVKAGTSQETFDQWLSNLRIHIVLGVPNKTDQEMLSDLWRGETKEVEGDATFNVNYEGVGQNQATGDVRATKAQGVSKTYTKKKEFVKFVKPEDLNRVPSMRSWVQVYDGNRTYPPQMVCHVPHFLQRSDKVSPITGEPLSEKTFLSLVRDGELNLVKAEDFSLRDQYRWLAGVGVDVSDEMAELEKEATA